MGQHTQVMERCLKPGATVRPKVEPKPKGRPKKREDERPDVPDMPQKRTRTCDARERLADRMRFEKQDRKLERLPAQSVALAREQQQ